MVGSSLPHRALERVSQIKRVSACLGLAAVLTACGGGDSEGVNQAAVDEAVKKALAAQAATQPADPPKETQPTPEASAAAAVEAEVAPSAASDQVDFVMPSFINVNLQEAQDNVQTLGIFFSVSHDLLGARSQFIDSNWKVCTQTPAAGTPIKGSAADYEGKFDFGAVKMSESCP